MHAAELEKVRENLATFRAAAASAADLVGPVEPAASPPAAPKLPRPGRKFVSGLLQMVVASAELQEPFGPGAVAAECNRRFQAHLKKPIERASLSAAGRRFLAQCDVEGWKIRPSGRITRVTPFRQEGRE